MTDSFFISNLDNSAGVEDHHHMELTFRTLIVRATARIVSSFNICGRMMKNFSPEFVQITRRRNSIFHFFKKAFY